MFDSEVGDGAFPVVRCAAGAPAVGAPAVGGLAAELRVVLAGLLRPGPAAVALLAGVDPAGLSEDGRVAALLAWERCARWVAAGQAAVVAAVAGPAPRGRDDFGREQVRVALREAGGTTRGVVDAARAWLGAARLAGEALAAGRISVAHAQVVARETALLEDAAVGEVCARVLGGSGWRRAARCTPAQFARHVRAAVIAADPVRAELAAARARAGRAVSRRGEPDAQASLTLTGPAVAVTAMWSALDVRAARAAAADTRTLDQRRFDAALALLTGTDPLPARAPARGPAGAPAPGAAGAPAPGGGGGLRRGLRPGVYVFADAATWAGLVDGPVELAGYGPIPAGQARACFTDAAWRAVVTDALAGLARSVSARSYTPSARLQRMLHVTDRTCLFPGCGAAVWFTDTDHSVPHAAGGGTDAANCGLLCRRHHRLKTFTRWTWRRETDGSIVWIDPRGGHWYADPTRYLMPEPPPEAEAEPPPGPEPQPGPEPPLGPEPPADPDIPPF